MQENGKRGGIRRKDDQLADTTVESLGSLVGTLLELRRVSMVTPTDRENSYLAVMSRLLNEIEDLLGESLIGLGPRCGVVLGHCRCKYSILWWFVGFTA